MYIPIDLLSKNEKEYSLSPEYIVSRKAAIRKESAAQLDGREKMLQRRAMLAQVAPEDLDSAFERYIGDNDLLPINYLELGNLKSRSVGRIRYFDRQVNRNAMATGFLISPDLVLTNRHVFKDADSFSDPFIDFDYAYDVNGKEEERIVFRLDPQKFFFSFEGLDCALIGIADIDETRQHSPKERGYLPLDPRLGKAGIGDNATIVQYPDGSYQQIALRENQILEIKPDCLLYVSDTSPGSSGAPVFNDQWQVIGLHSAGVPKKNPAGQYIDKNNDPIPEVNGHIDAGRVVWVSNTGIRISSLLAYWLSVPDLKASKYVQFLSGDGYLNSGVQTDSQPQTAKAVSVRADDQESVEKETASITRPGSPTITININLGAAQAEAKAPTKQVRAGQASAGVEALETKADDELNKDYSKYKGFDEYFMGISTPLPTLGTQLARKAATLVHNSQRFVLKYEHFSTIFHSVRRMPIVSAINVEGNPALRKDEAARKDTWLRDNRIDFDVQLNDDYYKSSGFDKGHMSRREDAKWGKTAAAAEAAAQLTCMYTNACPQVPELNRSVYGYHGLWGQLEQIVLEKGVESEAGKTSKICVYNGPVFVDTDPTYKGVQVPMRFFKLVVWLNKSNEPKATAFVLSQEDLVGGIQFEELQFDKEFVEHQCSIPYLEQLTSLTFKGIRDFDTWAGQNGGGAARIDHDGVEALIAKHA
jgi:endonuclease G, mitochondrial